MGGRGKGGGTTTVPLPFATTPATVYPTVVVHERAPNVPLPCLFYPFLSSSSPPHPQKLLTSRPSLNFRPWMEVSLRGLGSGCHLTYGVSLHLAKPTLACVQPLTWSRHTFPGRVYSLSVLIRTTRLVYVTPPRVPFKIYSAIEGQHDRPCVWSPITALLQRTNSENRNAMSDTLRPMDPLKSSEYYWEDKFVIIQVYSF